MEIAARETLLEAMDKTETFPFGRWLSVEEFYTWHAAFFVPDDTVRDLVKVVTDSKSVTWDDGMSQSVTAKTGIVTSDGHRAQSGCPASAEHLLRDRAACQRSFIFRLRGGERSVQHCTQPMAIVNAAMDFISLYFKNHIPGRSGRGCDRFSVIPAPWARSPAF